MVDSHYLARKLFSNRKRKRFLLDFCGHEMCYECVTGINISTFVQRFEYYYCDTGVCEM
jgi:hypothetical protein